MTTSSHRNRQKVNTTQSNLYGYRDMGSNWMRLARSILIGASGGAFIGSLIASSTGSIIGFFLGVATAIFVRNTEKTS